VTTIRQYFEHVQTALFIPETEDMASSVYANILIERNATVVNVIIPPSVLNTVTGFMAYLDTKLLVLAIGLVGMVLQLNSFASVVSCTTKRLMPVIGPRMLVDVRNIHYAKMIPMVMYHLANPAIVTGPAKEVTLAFKGAPPCWYLTKTANAACHLQLPTVMYPSLPHNPTKTTIPEAVGDQMTTVTVMEIPKTEDASNPNPQQVPAAADPT